MEIDVAVVIAARVRKLVGAIFCGKRAVSRKLCDRRLKLGFNCG